MQTCWSKYAECHVFLRQGGSFCCLADVWPAYGTSPQCALKSLGGHWDRLSPGCELHSHYFDPRSDDTCSFVKLCVENAWELNATARTVIPSWHTSSSPLQALTHTHTQQDTCALSLHPIPLSNGHPHPPQLSPPPLRYNVRARPLCCSTASKFHKQMSDRTTLIATLSLSVNIMQRGLFSSSSSI